MTDATSVHFFDTPDEWRRWLHEHHAHESSLIVGFHKTATGRASLTWPQSVDEALCYGWIDGVRKGIDAARYQIRFTPRKVGSIWSAVNIARVAVLTAEGRMSDAGLRAFAARSEQKSAIYAYEQSEHATLPPEYEARFRAAPGAWAFFQAQAPWYRKQMLWRIVSAKQEATRERRLVALIAASAAGARL
jgi:uncharacterized protein YdeI (YjbR/CyaY-like superfamily)